MGYGCTNNDTSARNSVPFIPLIFFIFFFFFIYIYLMCINVETRGYTEMIGRKSLGYLATWLRNLFLYPHSVWYTQSYILYFTAMPLVVASTTKTHPSPLDARVTNVFGCNFPNRLIASLAIFIFTFLNKIDESLLKSTCGLS